MYGNPQLARQLDQLHEIIGVLFTLIKIGSDVILRRLERRDMHSVLRQRLPASFRFADP